MLHTATWATIVGSDPAPVLTNRGTRPGSSWADVTFATILRRILKRRDEARSQDATPMIPWDGSQDIFHCGEPRTTVPVTDTIWADDLAACFAYPSAHRVEPGIVTESGLLADSFQGFGMTLNTQKDRCFDWCQGPGFSTCLCPSLCQSIPARLARKCSP